MGVSKRRTMSKSSFLTLTFFSISVWLLSHFNKMSLKCSFLKINKLPCSQIVFKNNEVIKQLVWAFETIYIIIVFYFLLAFFSLATVKTSLVMMCFIESITPTKDNLSNSNNKNSFKLGLQLMIIFSLN